ncbi:MAG: hypothetical protein ACJAS1_001456 [Oleiphilaceae bacterium]|jgi:hypothetical protein
MDMLVVGRKMIIDNFSPRIDPTVPRKETDARFFEINVVTAVGRKHKFYAMGSNHNDAYSVVIKRKGFKKLSDISEVIVTEVSDKESDGIIAFKI